VLLGGVCLADDASRERPRSPVPRPSWHEASAGEVTGARTAETAETAAMTRGTAADDRRPLR
jgi:hypothetical protein